MNMNEFDIGLDCT